MDFQADPVIGSWYRRLDRPQAFQVVAFDRHADSVDIEYFDGTLDEWPLEHWHALPIEPCDAPQDWTGPFDNIERDDLGPTDLFMEPEDWREPIEGPQDEGERRLLESETRRIPPARVARSRHPTQRCKRHNGARKTAARSTDRT